MDVVDVDSCVHVDDLTLDLVELLVVVEALLLILLLIRGKKARDSINFSSSLLGQWSLFSSAAAAPATADDSSSTLKALELGDKLQKHSFVDEFTKKNRPNIEEDYFYMSQSIFTCTCVLYVYG